MSYTTQVEATQDAVRRAKNYGYDWHVIQIHDELIGPTHTAVSEYYFKTHPEAKSLYRAKAPKQESIRLPWRRRLALWWRKITA